MQLVIEISDGLHNNLDTIKNGSIASKIILDCVRKGQVLPKRHGRLIDADEFKNYCQTGLENVKPLFKTEKYCKLAIDITTGIMADVDEMETIIEADKEEQE